ncbi:MAG: hypothetical protein KKA75_00065 [Proteobacteria bacterium]|nr:hypothetical protein [Pseudomonadota bacterium]
MKRVDLFRSYFTKLRGREYERGIKTKMRVKLAAKMLVIVYPRGMRSLFLWGLDFDEKREVFNADYLNIE